MPDDASVTPEYVSAQLHERFPERLEEDDEPETVEVPADRFNELVDTVEDLTDGSVTAT